MLSIHYTIWMLSKRYTPFCFLDDAQRLEQYFTFSQSRSHFFRQVKGRSQTGQTLVGKLDFFIIT